MTSKMRLKAKSAFSLPAVARSHGWIRLPPFSWEEEAEILHYVTLLPSRRVVPLVIKERGSGVEVEGLEVLTDSERSSLREQVRWMLGLDQDFTPFYDLARSEPKLRPMVEGARGRVLRSASLFEDTVKTILTTNTSWAGTIRMAEALVSHFGEPVESEPERKAFPTPERIARSREKILREEVRLGYRAPYVLSLARSLAGGERDLEGLKGSDRSTEELRQELLGIDGIGPYAAANLLMLLGRYDYLPVDSWARKVVSHEWYEGEPVGREEVEQAFEEWGPWKGLAYWFWAWSYHEEV